MHNTQNTTSLEKRYEDSVGWQVVWRAWQSLIKTRPHDTAGLVYQVEFFCSKTTPRLISAGRNVRTWLCRLPLVTACLRHTQTRSDVSCTAIDNLSSAKWEPDDNVIGTLHGCCCSQTLAIAWFIGFQRDYEPVTVNRCKTRNCTRPRDLKSWKWRHWTDGIRNRENKENYAYDRTRKTLHAIFPCTLCLETASLNRKFHDSEIQTRFKTRWRLDDIKILEHGCRWNLRFYKWSCINTTWWGGRGHLFFRKGYQVNPYELVQLSVVVSFIVTTKKETRLVVCT